MIWGGAPAQAIIVGTSNTGGGGATVVADFRMPAAVLASWRNDRGALIENIAEQRLDAALFGEASARQRSDRLVTAEFGAAAARYSGVRAEMLAVHHADPGAPIEALGAAAVSITGDSTLPIESMASQQVNADAPAEALAESERDGGGPVEWLGGGITIIADAATQLEWGGTALEPAPSLETGPERRLLATPGRVRLLRRN